jgi:hypothetical protein
MAVATTANENAVTIEAIVVNCMMWDMVYEWLMKGIRLRKYGGVSSIVFEKRPVILAVNGDR